MSVDKALREMIAAEVRSLVGPLTSAIQDLQAQGAVIERLASALGQPIRRGPGRPPKKVALVVAAGPRRRGRPPGSRNKVASGDSRGCSVMGCKRPARSKGFCAAHYQKYRMLQRTGRLPSDWKEDAAPQSVENIVLPRGRAGAKALAEAKKK
ncbi:MAG: cell wall protein [Archangium sp.]|nr:cell wall protein [Archangium sp.]